MLKPTHYFIIFIFFLIFLVRFYAKSQVKIPDNSLVKITGRISTEPVIKNYQTIFKIDEYFLAFNNFNLKQTFHLGDRVEVIGKVKIIKKNAFIFQIYLFNPKITTLAKTSNFGNINKKLKTNILKILPEPQASLLNGILLGEKANFSPNFWQALKKTGTLHLVVVSGSNLAFVSSGIMYFLWQILKIHRKVSLSVSIIFIIIYIIIVGLEPPVARAGIMAILTIAASFLGRPASGWWFLTVAAGLMLVFDPLLLFFPSFQLTIASTAGIMLLGPKNKTKINNFFQGLWQTVKGELQISLAAFVFTAPVIWLNFQEVSFLGILVNPLVNWLIPYIMIFGVLMLTISFIYFPLALIIQPFCWVLLTSFVKVIEFFV